MIAYKTYEFEYQDKMLTVDVEVDVFIQKPWGGSPHTCDNPYDYYGYTEINSYDVVFYEVEDEVGNLYQFEGDEEFPVGAYKILDQLVDDDEYEPEEPDYY